MSCESECTKNTFYDDFNIYSMSKRHGVNPIIIGGVYMPLCHHWGIWYFQDGVPDGGQLIQ